MRFDVGLTVNFQFFKDLDLTLVAEILNVFNNTNVAGYSWIQAFKDYDEPIRIPHVFTSRFFNVGFEARF